MNDLTDSTAEVPETEEAIAVPEAFHVHDAATANWVVRKIMEARQYAERVKEWAAAEVRRAEREEQFLMFRFGAQLEDWVRHELEASSGRRKSIGLPARRTGFRLRPSRLEVQDEQAVISWCKQNLPTAIVIKELLSKGEMIEHVKHSGELPPGCEITGGGETFYIG